MRWIQLAGCGLLFLWSATAAGEPWTRFRGPNGSGVSPDSLPAEWTAADYNWQAKLPGIGHSSPVVWGPHVYIMSADPENATQYVLAIEVESGALAWQREFPLQAYHIHARNSFASVTPTVDQDRVYVAWATPAETTLSALDHSGQLAWQRNLGSFASQHGFGSSPILYQDLVILSILEMKPDPEGPQTETSRIVALDRRNGEVRWTAPRRSEVASYSVPCLYQPPRAPVELICCSTSHGMFSLNPDSGVENWALNVFEMRTVSSPIVAEGLIFGTTGSGGGGNYVVAVKPGPEPRVAYEIRKQAPYVPTPVAQNGLVFLWYDKGIVTCIRAADGSQVWQERVGGNYSGAPVIAGGRLYCVDEDGVVVVLAAGPDFKLLGKYPLGEASRSTPAVADGRIYFRTYSQLFSLGGKSSP